MNNLNELYKLPKYQKLMLYMYLKKKRFNQCFVFSDISNIVNLGILGVFPNNIDLESNKTALSSLLQYLRKNDLANTNGNGIWYLTDGGFDMAEYIAHKDENNTADVVDTIWPEDYEPDEQPSTSAQTSNLSGKVQELEDSLKEKLRLIGERDELIARLHKRISVLEAEKAELNVKLQQSSYHMHKHSSEEYTELVDRATSLVTDVINLFM